MHSQKQNPAGGRGGLTPTRMSSCCNFTIKRRFPPYGKQLMELRLSGKSPARVVQIVFDWNLAKAYPRVIIPDDPPVSALDFRFLAGIACQIVCHGKDSHRVDAVVEAILAVNPLCLTTFNLGLVGTGDACTIIKPHEQLQEAA